MEKLENSPYRQRIHTPELFASISLPVHLCYRNVHEHYRKGLDYFLLILLDVPSSILLIEALIFYSRLVTLRILLFNQIINDDSSKTEAPFLFQ